MLFPLPSCVCSCHVYTSSHITQQLYGESYIAAAVLDTLYTTHKHAVYKYIANILMGFGADAGSMMLCNTQLLCARETRDLPSEMFTKIACNNERTTAHES